MPGATIIPCLLSSDKTQGTKFRNKSFYPLYLTIGNLPKELRRKPSQKAYILLAYLPVIELENITPIERLRLMRSDLFHLCLERILKPLERAGTFGICMASGDGIIRRCHPIFAAYIGDYPEQILVTGAKTGQCPTCSTPASCQRRLYAGSQGRNSNRIEESRYRREAVKPVY